MIVKKDNEVKSLISSAQTLTNAWADLGDRIACGDTKNIALWLNVDINDTQNLQIRMVCFTGETATDTYVPVIDTPSASKVSIEAEVIELNVDADTKIVRQFDIMDQVYFIKFQVMAGTVGATPGKISEAFVSMSSVRG